MRLCNNASDSSVGAGVRQCGIQQRFDQTSCNLKHPCCCADCTRSAARLSSAGEHLCQPKVVCVPRDQGPKGLQLLGKCSGTGSVVPANGFRTPQNLLSVCSKVHYRSQPRLFSIYSDTTCTDMQGCLDMRLSLPCLVRCLCLTSLEAVQTSYTSPAKA